MTGFWAWFHDSWEIVGSLGSAAAAVIAVLLASREREDRKLAERERDEAQRRQRVAEQAEVQRERERQARQVAVWIDTDGPLAWQSATTGEWKQSESFLNIANYSNHPIFEVAPCDYLDHGDPGPSSIGPLSEILLPGGSRRLPLGQVLIGEHGAINPLWVFRDLAGNFWTLDHAGFLRSDLIEPPVQEWIPPHTQA